MIVGPEQNTPKNGDLTVFPGRSIRGIVGRDAGFQAPGDKSLSHRAALFAALAEGESRIENFQISGVTRAMLEALTALGVEWELEETTLYVQGKGIRGFRPPEKPISCGNSATTMRLLAGALAASGVSAVLDGSPGLRSRPMDRIVFPLREMGVSIDAGKSGTAPLKINGRPENRALSPLDYTLSVASAQVKSCLLLASLAANGPTTLREPGPSRDHTERMLSSMGVKIEKQEGLGAAQKHVYTTRLFPGAPLSLSPL